MMISLVLFHGIMIKLLDYFENIIWKDNIRYKYI
jgi:hypothetical protein